MCRLKESGRFSVKSDVYSFGVFLLELVSGREAKADPSIIKWVYANLVKKRACFYICFLIFWFLLPDAFQILCTKLISLLPVK